MKKELLLVLLAMGMIAPVQAISLQDDFAPKSYSGSSDDCGEEEDEGSEE